MAKCGSMMEFEACNSPSKVQYDQQKAFEHFTRKTKRIQNLHHEGRGAQAK
jgi:hypothetical protein